MSSIGFISFSISRMKMQYTFGVDGQCGSGLCKLGFLLRRFSAYIIKNGAYTRSFTGKPLDRLFGEEI